MNCSINAGPYNYYIEKYFCEHYIGKSYFELDPYRIEVFIEIEFHRGKILFGNGWKYFTWVDSFVKRFERKFHFKTFLEEIHWSTALTILHCQDRKKMERK